MYAQLGEVRFELLQGFTSLEATHAAKFAKHEVLAGRPRLQALQNELAELRFGVKLHWMLGNPDTAYKGLLAALEARQAVSLVYGSGRFAGWWVIERLTERTLIQDAQGRTAARELDVELTEFAGDPNNLLPTPAVMDGRQNPLLSLLPESVQAQAGEVMKAMETGVKIYRAAEGGIAEMQSLITAAKELKHDLNGQLINLYRVVQHHFDEFVRQFEWTLTGREVFDRLQSTPPESMTDIQRAARFFYLQHTAFGGKTVDQHFGTATTGRGFAAADIAGRLKAAQQRLNGVYIENEPWEKCFKRYDREHTSSTPTRRIGRQRATTSPSIGRNTNWWPK